MRGAGRCSLRAATPPTGGVNAPMTLNVAKQAQRPCQSERRSSGAARGDYEAFVPSKNVGILLVAAWKSTSLLPARLLPKYNMQKSFTIAINTSRVRPKSSRSTQDFSEPLRQFPQTEWFLDESMAAPVEDFLSLAVDTVAA
jgi:hypothetical protein